MDRSVGDFEILEDLRQGSGLWKLGEGSFGVTYRAKNAILGEDVALKVLKFDKDDSRFGRFKGEASALHSLLHPHIARLFHVGLHQGTPYCAIEYCDGGSLHDLVEAHGALPVPLVLVIGRQLASALRHAHERKIIHRDIKPENVMIGDSPGAGKAIKLIDFGLAKAFDTPGADSVMVSHDGFKGSKLFASPEQFREREIDQRTDLYSLGMTLWYLHEGGCPKPFQGKSQAEIGVAHLERKFELSTVDPWLRPVLELLLAKEPEDRYQNATAVESEFEKRIRQWETDTGVDVTLHALLENLKKNGAPPPTQRLVTETETPLIQEAGENKDHFTDIRPNKAWESPIGSLYFAKAKSGDVISLLIAQFPNQLDDVSTSLGRDALHRLVRKHQRLARMPGYPRCLEVHREVRWFHSGEVAVVSELSNDGAAVSMRDVIRANKQISLRDLLEIGILTDLANALDFVAEWKLPTPATHLSQVYLVSEESLPLKVSDLSEKDVSRWPRVRLKMSPLRFPKEVERLIAATFASGITETISGPASGVGATESGVNPTAAFAALVYWLIGGTPAADAAFNSRSGYSNIRGLGAEANEILRTALANPQLIEQGCRGLTAKLCLLEGLPLPPSIVSWLATATPEPFDNEATPAPPAPLNPTHSFRSTRKISTDEPTTDPSWEVSPKVWAEQHGGKAISPYTGLPISVPGDRWRPKGRIFCKESDRTFVLPDKDRLPPLFAILRGPQKLISPYIIDPADPYFRFDLTDASLWESGRAILCQGSGLEMRLPDKLPPLVADVDKARPGLIISPYQPGTFHKIPPDEWFPGSLIQVAGKSLMLPPDLPPAIEVSSLDLDPDKRAVRCPFGDGNHSIDPDDWVAGEHFRCEETGCFYQFPPEIPHLTAEVFDGGLGIVIDPFTGQKRSIPGPEWKTGAVFNSSIDGRQFSLQRSKLPSLLAAPDPKRTGWFLNPYEKSSSVPIPPSFWRGGESVPLPDGRSLLLPDTLPELPVARSPEEKDSADQVTLPFGGDRKAPISEADWEPGKVLRDEESGLLFRLPPDLPPFVRTAEFDGSVMGFQGKVIDPWSGVSVTVPGDKWKSNAVVPSTMPGRAFRLPASAPMPLLEGKALEDGTVISPYAPDSAPFRIKEEEWNEGREVKCHHTDQLLILRNLPILVAQLFGAEPGKISSPLIPGQPTIIPPSDWKPGQPVSLSGIGHRLPATLPDLPLGRFVSPDFDGIISPHTQTRVPIAVADWAPERVVACPESGLLFQMPPDLPGQPKPARDLLPKEVGFFGAALSPYGKNLFRTDIPGTEWVPGGIIRCSSGQYFRLPNQSLPELTARPLPEAEQDYVGKVYSPFAPDRVMDVPGEHWWPKGKIACSTFPDRTFLLPSDKDLPLLRARAIEDRPGIVRCPYTGRELSPPPSEWQPNAKIASDRPSWHCLLPAKLPTLAEATVTNDSLCIADQMARVPSPYAPESDPVEIPENSWNGGECLHCPHTSQLFRLPAQIPQWVRLARVVGERCGFKGAVASPWKEGHEVIVDGVDWVPGRTLTCDKTGKPFALPFSADGLPPLTAELDETQPGRVFSPYTGKKEFTDIDPDRWNPGERIACKKSGRDFLLPGDLPLLEAIILPGQPGRARSRFGSKSEFEVDAALWAPRGEVVCSETQRKLQLPANGLPEPAPATIKEDGTGSGVSSLEVHSPYGRKRKVEVSIRDWRGGALLRCPESRLLFALPPDDELPSVAKPGTIIQSKPGIIVSPYTKKEVTVTGPDWYEGASIECPDTPGFSIRIPKGIPPMTADPGKIPGTILSPYAPDKGDRAIDPANWVNGKIVPCPATKRPLRLRDPLPPLVASPLADLPGVVVSPFDPKTRVPIPPLKWKGGSEIVCPKTKRDFVLPGEKDLPPPALSSKIDPVGARATSPYGCHPESRVREWRPGAVLVCGETSGLYHLPGGKELPEAIGELPDAWRGAKGIPTATGGKVLSPFTGAEMEVPGPQWERGGRVTCRETGQPFRLPSDLPSLEAIIESARPGWVTSPYAPKRPFKVELRDWVAGGSLTCPKTRRVMLLPEKGRLPQRDGQRELEIDRVKARTKRTLAVAAVMAIASGAALLTHQYWLPDRSSTIAGPTLPVPPEPGAKPEPPGAKPEPLGAKPEPLGAKPPTTGDKDPPIVPPPPPPPAPKTPDALYAEAQTLIGEERWKYLRSAAELWLEQENPVRAGEAYLILGEELEQANRLDESRINYQKAETAGNRLALFKLGMLLRPSDPKGSAQRFLAFCKTAAPGENEEKRQALEAAAALGSPEAFRLLAEEAFKHRQFASGISHLEKALSIFQAGNDLTSKSDSQASAVKRQLAENWEKLGDASSAEGEEKEKPILALVKELKEAKLHKPNEIKNAEINFSIQSEKYWIEAKVAFDNAATAFENAITYGSGSAARKLGNLFLGMKLAASFGDRTSGEPDDVSTDTAAESFKTGILLGDTKSKVELAKLYTRSFWIEDNTENPAQVESLLTEADVAGDEEAPFLLGLILHKNFEYEKALANYQRAESRGFKGEGGVLQERIQAARERRLGAVAGSETRPTGVE